jgi:hypothetical protein
LSTNRSSASYGRRWPFQEIKEYRLAGSRRPLHTTKHHTQNPTNACTVRALCQPSDTFRIHHNFHPPSACCRHALCDAALACHVRLRRHSLVSLANNLDVHMRCLRQCENDIAIICQQMLISICTKPMISDLCLIYARSSGSH